jgi:PPOX class probable FMN-dependent enzyme
MRSRCHATVGVRVSPGVDDYTYVTSVAELERYGVPSPVDRDKVLSEVGEVHREWIRATTLVMVATSSATGRCDVSPKGDPAGFVHVVHSQQLAVPDRPGNRRLDGFHNLLRNPHVGMLLLVPGRGDTLRINGRARLVSDGPCFDDMVVRGHRPKLALLVDVEEVFFHCPKAFRRGQTWDPRSWRPESVRPFADIALALWREGQPADEVRRHFAEKVDAEPLYGTPE